MANGDKGAVSAAAVREVPVDWEALEDAFENNAPEVHSYLHLGTGEVLRVVDGIADPEMHARIAADTNYLRIDPVSSREQYRWMERFIQMLEDGELRDKLTQAIDGKGAFRRFKDVLMAHAAERERWFAFRSERLRVFMEAWLSAHALRPIARPIFPTTGSSERPSAPPGPVLPDEVDDAALRRARAAEALRRQLRDLADTLGVRDLEKVTAFAEFVKARRSARAFAHRQDSHDAALDADSAEPPSSDLEGDGPER
ncbi:MAG TPA: UPF0158 family protein [Polyangiaceae bacterium]|jgi:hypothetical protein|nr:UPF0158 family protein [Polyangiaceae bacterium]